MRPRFTYLSGHVCEAILGARPDLGVILTPQTGYKVDLATTPWAADNGCFSSPELFRLDSYLVWLAARRFWRDTCLFATAPDVLGDARATWLRSAPILREIRDLGLPAALVAQDGLEGMAVDWDAFDVLFIGGSTSWKLSHHAKVLTARAKQQGKSVHMGRVNGVRRMQTALMWGCDSADGTYLAYGPDKNVPRLCHFLDSLERSPPLNFAGA